MEVDTNREFIFLYYLEIFINKKWEPLVWPKYYQFDHNFFKNNFDAKFVYLLRVNIWGYEAD